MAMYSFDIQILLICIHNFLGKFIVSVFFPVTFYKVSVCFYDLVVYFY